MTNSGPVSLAYRAAEPEGIGLRRGVKALIESGDQVLLVKERHADGSTFWTLPGGGVRGQETLAEGLRRELAEELDCRVLVGEPVERFWYAHTSGGDVVTRYTVFSSTLATGVRPVRSEGTLAYRWARRTAPPASTLPQVRFVLGGSGGTSGPDGGSRLDAARPTVTR